MPCSDMKDGDDKDKAEKNDDAVEVVSLKINPLGENCVYRIWQSLQFIVISAAPMW